MKRCWILSNTFSASIEMIMWPVYFSSLVGNIGLEIQSVIFGGLKKELQFYSSPHKLSQAYSYG